MDEVLKGAWSILTLKDFPLAARAIFDSCKHALGATAGYVALLSNDGAENEVLFLDAGGAQCAVDPLLPMPIRGLRAEAYKKMKVVYDNDFDNSEWARFMPPGHAPLVNVLFAPLILEGRAVGLLGLANKDGRFTENDANLATMFASLAAISLWNSKVVTALEEANKKLKMMTSATRHDVLNQLVVLQGFGGLAEELATDENQKPFFEHLRTTVKMITHEMEFTKSYEDFGAKMPAWLDLNGLVEVERGILKPSGITLDSDLGEYEVYADPLFGKVFHNLVDNTIRHGKNATRVKMSNHESSDGLHIIYEDDGSGISEAIRPKLFEHGAGLHTGYGLFLIREILGMTGITISENGRTGEGVRFEIRVPSDRFRRKVRNA